MDKRIDKKRQRVKALRSKLKNASAIFFCIMLLIFSIIITDMSIRRMTMCNDEKYAIAVSFQEGNMLRLDIVGERLMINIEPAVRMADYIAGNTKKCYGKLVKSIRTEFKKRF